jgi:hypothetical protein
MDIIWIARQVVEIASDARDELNAVDKSVVCGSVEGEVWEIGIVDDGGALIFEGCDAGVEGIDFRPIGRGPSECVARDADPHTFEAVGLTIIFKLEACFERINRCVVILGVFSCNCREEICSILDGTCQGLRKRVSQEGAA